MTRTKILAAALVAASLTAAAPAPAQASTASRLARLERAQKSTARTVATLRTRLAQTRRDLAASDARLTNAEAGVDGVATLLLNCFQSTSFDLDATVSFLTAAPFITTSLNSGAAGPFYLATLNPDCVGAITPPLGVARAARTMFPNAHLPIRG